MEDTKEQLLKMLKNIEEDFQEPIVFNLPVDTKEPVPYFKVSDLIEAQANRDHDLNQRHDELKQFGIEIHFTKKKFPRFRVPMCHLAPWIFFDCSKTQDFSLIPEYLNLAFPHLDEKDRAVEKYVMAFYDYYSSKDHFKNSHVMTKNLMAGAKIGHLKSREILIINWLFKPDRVPELDQDTVNSWIDSILDNKHPEYSAKDSFYANAYWAIEEGRFKTKRLREIKRISRRQDGSLEWRIGSSSIDLYGIPKATLTEFRDCLAEQIGHVVAENMKYSGLETSLKPIRFVLSHQLLAYILPDSHKNTVELLVGSSGISIATVKLKTNKPKKIQAFFNNLNNIIHYESLVSMEFSKNITAFANNEEKTA